jgi:diaminobutyrate-2-oxoglutarate transaminase
VSATKPVSESGSPSNTFEEFESSVRSYSRTFPKLFTRAQGAYLYADDGSRYLDFLTGCSSLNYGHNHPVLKQALLDYIDRDGIAHGLDLHIDGKEDFLREFAETILAPRDLDYVVQFPGPTGANAVEAALKLARKVTGRQSIIAFTNGFHGVTLGALACTGNEHHRGGAGMPLGGVDRMPYDGYFGKDVDTAEYLDDLLSDPSSGIDAPAAVIVETVQGEGGLNAASPDWIREVARITRRHGALFIVDDIQAGAGRTGTFFSFEPAGVKPDIVTMAKSISGYGLPMSLVLIDRRFDQWAPGEHNGTFRGNCHAFVTATAALREFWRDDSFEKAIRERGKQLTNGLVSILRKHGSHAIERCGRGMMQGVRFDSGDVAADVVSAAFDRGLIIETSGPEDEIVKCLAPLTITEGAFDRGLALLESAVSDALRQPRKDAA